MAADPITAAITTPKSMTTPTGHVEARDADELVKLDQLSNAKAAQKASRSVWAGCRMSKASPPGTIGDSGETSV